jgi:hypothetical protein
MTDREDDNEMAVAILTLMNEAIESRNAEAMTELWRRFADWHGMNPDIAVVLQEHQAQVAAGMDVFDRIRARISEKQSNEVH